MAMEVSIVEEEFADAGFVACVMLRLPWPVTRLMGTCLQVKAWMPSGSKSCCLAKTSRGSLVAFSMMAPVRNALMEQ